MSAPFWKHLQDALLWSGAFFLACAAALRAASYLPCDADLGCFGRVLALAILFIYALLAAGLAFVAAGLVALGRVASL